MLLPLAISLVNVVLVQSSVLPESYNIVLEESADFKVDETFDAGLAMVEQDYRKPFLFHNKENKLDTLNRLVSNKNKKRASVNRFRLNTRGHLKTFPKIPNRKSKSYTKLRTPSSMPPIKNKNVPENIELGYEYQYYEMLKEYYDESLNDAKSNQSYHIRKKGKSENAVLSSLEEIIPLEGLSALGHISMNLIKKKDIMDPHLDNKVLVQKLWKFIKIMLIIYVILAIPLWCTKGWCCCCLFCKLFKPRRTIDEAKRYLTRNPPGILEKRGRIHEYEPTNQERESYEEFEHLIRTT